MLFFNRIDFYHAKNNNLKDNIYDLINKIKGKFTLIMDKYLFLDKYELFNILYLIKTKIIKDISEKRLTFNTFEEIINYITSLKEPKLNYISLAFTLNNYYTSSAYVSITSILHSKNFYTYISFYLIVPKNFTKKNKDFLRSLYDQYDYFNITFIEMDERYDKAFISRYITKEAYYRFSLGELLYSYILDH